METESLTKVKEEQSRRNWTVKVEFRLFMAVARMHPVIGSFRDNLSARERRDWRHLASDGQKRRMCSRVPADSFVAHRGRRHFPDLLGYQCLERWSVGYLPESMRAWTVALLTSKGFEPAMLQMGWGLERDIWWGWKYLREENWVASFWSDSSQ